MARYPRDNQEADMWLRRIAKDFLAGRWLLRQLAKASHLRRETVVVALFSTGHITEGTFVCIANGMQRLAECERVQARRRYGTAVALAA